MKKLLYFAVVSAGLILTSCSMSRDAAYLHSQKLQAKQELVKQTNKQELATVNEQVQTNVTALPQTTVAETTPTATEPKQSNAPKHSLRQSMHALGQTKLVKKSALAFKQTVNDFKNTDKYANLLKQKSNTAHASFLAHPSEMNYLLLWILCLAAGLVCSIIAGIIIASWTASYLNGGLYYGTLPAYPVGATILSILAWLFYIAFAVFFTIWLIHLIRNA